MAQLNQHKPFLPCSEDWAQTFFAMLSFFPTPYPDEILYSILARYHIRSGNTGLKLTMNELFNANNAIATADLPCNLDALVAKLALISNITIETIVQKHTLYPFYAAFLPPERAQQVLQAMRSNDGGGIHDKVGIRASLVSVPQYFRFCPQCLQDDQKAYGELYWHRIHQVPGVFICPHHAEALQESTVPLQGLNRHAYVAADRRNCPPAQLEQPFSQKTLNFLPLMAQDACFLLENELPSRDLNWFRQQYLSLLIERGLATATGRVHQRELLSHTNLKNKSYRWGCGGFAPSQGFHPCTPLLSVAFTF